jgi:dihydroflavonol-4-reductase
VEKGLPVVVVNPAVVLGVRDIKPTPSGQIIVNVLNRKMPGYFESGLNAVDVEDVARGHVLAAEKGRIGERYILGNENMELRQFLGLVGEVAGVEPPKRKLPRALGLALGQMYQLVSRITGKPPLITPAMVRLATTHAYFDVSKAVNELGLPQTPIRETIGKAVNWFRENGYVTAT